MKIVTETEQVADQIRTWLPQLDGSLRIWGLWMGGKPFDNCYTAVACEGADDLLRIDFGAGEALNVWGPRGATLEDEVFRIVEAERVRFEWCYSAGPGPQFLDFTCTPHGVTATANSQRALRPDPRAPAVELIAFTATNINRYQ